MKSVYSFDFSGALRMSISSGSCSLPHLYFDQVKREINRCWRGKQFPFAPLLIWIRSGTLKNLLDLQCPLILFLCMARNATLHLCSCFCRGFVFFFPNLQFKKEEIVYEELHQAQSLLWQQIIPNCKSLIEKDFTHCRVYSQLKWCGWSKSKPTFTVREENYRQNA